MNEEEKEATVVTLRKRLLEEAVTHAAEISMPQNPRQTFVTGDECNYWARKVADACDAAGMQADFPTAAGAIWFALGMLKSCQLDEATAHRFVNAFWGHQ